MRPAGSSSSCRRASPRRVAGPSSRSAAKLADPYGQLELRPAADGMSTDGGPGTLPTPIDLAIVALGEATEARLVQLTGTVAEKPTKATSGDIALQVEMAGGTRVKVMADASSGIAATAVSKGGVYRLTGIAGQRASHKGALDGYRVWLRDPSDLQLVAAPSASPSPTPSPTPKHTAAPTPRPSASAPADTRAVSVASALGITDRDVAIEATVTAPGSLLDATGRRIVVQDSTGAIEVLLAKDITAPGVGTRIRAVGRVGTAYGAPRLRATSIERLGAGAAPAPLRVSGQLTAAHTWRLVTTTGRIEDVRKLGDRWRAEIVVGAARLVLIGQPGAKIPVDAILEGHAIEVVGIVRPAYPSASDRRATILPRSRGDVRVGAATSGGARGRRQRDRRGGFLRRDQRRDEHREPAAQGARRPTRPFRMPTSRTSPRSWERPSGSAALSWMSGPTVSCSTTARRTRRSCCAKTPRTGSRSSNPGDAINVIGRVERLDDETLGVVVTDPAAIVLGSDPAATGVAGLPPASPAAKEFAEDAGAGVNSAGFGDDLGDLPGAGAGLASLLGISLASVAVTLLRRRKARRLLAARVAARLSAFAGGEAVGEPIAVPSGHAGGA